VSIVVLVGGQSIGSVQDTDIKFAAQFHDVATFVNLSTKSLTNFALACQKIFQTLKNAPVEQMCPLASWAAALPEHDGRSSIAIYGLLPSQHQARDGRHFCLRNIKHGMDTTHETYRDNREDRIAWAIDLNMGGMFDSFDFTNLEARPEEAGADENEGFILPAQHQARDGHHFCLRNIKHGMDTTHETCRDYREDRIA
jgi:hypothetical protein